MLKDTKLSPQILPVDRMVEIGHRHDLVADQRQDAPSTEVTSTTASQGSTVRKGMLSLVDQGVVSATNFLTMVMVGRTTEYELGVYQLGFSVVMLAAGIQMALISMPYAVFGNRMEQGERAKYAGSMLIHQGVLSLVGSLLLILSGIGIAAWLALTGASFDGSSLAAELPFFWVLAAMLPFILLREFIRRIAFAHLQIVTVLVMDIAVAAMQLSGLFGLKLAGYLSAGTAFGTIGAACAVTGLGIYALMRHGFTPTRTKAIVDLQHNWSFGKWAFAAQVAYMGIAYSLPWLLAFLMDPHATGEFTACLSLVMIANPILLGLNNFLYPQAIRAFDAGGLAALRRLTFRATLTTVGIVSLLMLTLMLFGGKLVAFIYGTNLDGLEPVMIVLSVNIVLFALSMGPENGLMTLRRPEVVFWANVVGLVVTLVAGCALIVSYGVMGAAVTTLIGQSAALVSKGYVFLSVSDEKLVAVPDWSAKAL